MAHLAGLAVAILAVLSPAAPAAATSGTVPSADDVRVYEGQYFNTVSTYTVRCTGDSCVLTVDDPPALLAEFMTGPLTVTGGSTVVKLPNTCGTTDDGFDPPRTLSLTLTATDVTAVVVVEKGDWRVGSQHCIASGGTKTLRAKLRQPVAATSEPTAPAPRDPVAAGGDVAGGTGSDAPTTSRLGTGAADAPSVLSGLRTVADVEAPNLLLAALVTVVLVILIAVPTTLLNSAAEHGSDRFSAWWRRRRSGATGETTDDIAPSRPWWWAAGGVLTAGVIASFVDPQFGFNLGSARTMLSVVVGFAIEVVLGWFVVVHVVRRGNPGVTPSYTFRPVTLVLVVAAVAFSRVTEFEPGIIFGLVAGVGFAALVGRREEARVALVPLAYGAAVGLVGWAGYHLVDDATGAAGVFVAESLSAVAVAGLAALPIALFPVPGMPGAAVFAWDRRVWAACYAAGLFAFFLVLMPTPYAWDEVGWSLRAWVLGYLAYLAAATLAWWLVRRGRPVEGAEDATAHVEDATPDVVSS